MIHELDETLKSILAITDPVEVEVSFATPDRLFTQNRPTLNLFLYEVKENRGLRDQVPRYERSGANILRQMPPLRMDCCYLVTAWSMGQDENKIVEEHKLLAQALMRLARYPHITQKDLKGSLATTQELPLPVSLAQGDATTSTKDFWAALGITPRPFFHVIVTIALPFEEPKPAGPPVTGKAIHIKGEVPENAATNILESWFEIAGVVRDSQTTASIKDVQLTLVELGRTTTSDQNGHFAFGSLTAGNYTLQASANHFVTHQQAIVVPGIEANSYDIGLTPQP